MLFLIPFLCNNADYWSLYEQDQDYFHAPVLDFSVGPI